MDWIALLKATGLSFLFLIVLFVPMEKVFPAKPGQAFMRKAWWMDLCFFLGQYLIWNMVILWLLDYFDNWLTSITPLSVRQYIAQQPFWLQAAEVIILSDILIYWGHRLQHKVDFLWRFHKVHHTAEHMDWLAAHREHQIDTIYTMGLINLPAIIMGFPLQTIAGVIAFRGIWAIYIHSNVRLPFPALRWLIGSPELHHWHHDRERDAGNYANISPLMDIIFGTHICPNHEPEAFGIKEKTPTTYIGQLIEPLLPQKMYTGIVSVLKRVKKQEPPKSTCKGLENVHLNKT